jgi:hypothetical protein
MALAAYAIAIAIAIAVICKGEDPQKEPPITFPFTHSLHT